MKLSKSDGRKLTKRCVTREMLLIILIELLMTS